MRAKQWILASLTSIAFAAAPTRAAELIFQPGPAHSQDIWTTSIYSYTGKGGGPGGGLANDLLRVGGWGDYYYSLLQFNLNGLPGAASAATLRLYSPGGSTPMTLYQVLSPWDWKTMGTGSDHDRLWWADRPSVTQIGSIGGIPAPGPGPSNIDITDLYNKWQSGKAQNYGIELQPTLINNKWNYYASSRTSDVTRRPMLVIVPQTTEHHLRFPLAGENPVYLETESGGLSADPHKTAAGDPYFDTSHTEEKAYYAVDFTLLKTHGTVDSNTDSVVAAGSGKIANIIALQDDTGKWYSKVGIDHGVLDATSANPKDHLFTIYQEFFHEEDGKDAKSKVVQAVLKVLCPDAKDVDQCRRRPIAEGTKIGDLTKGNGNHLHFQLATCFEKGCSTKANGPLDPLGRNAPLERVTVDGRPITTAGYKLGGGCKAETIPGCHPLQETVGKDLAKKPILTNAGNGLLFNVNAGDLGVGVNDFLYVDPAAASAYDFKLQAGPNFKSVVIPQADGSSFGLWLYDPLLKQFVFAAALSPDVPYDFGPLGIDQFRITGIDPGIADLVAGLKFTDPGWTTFTETPVSADVPEPSTLALFGFSLLCVWMGVAVRLRVTSRARLVTAFYEVSGR
jgi:hypothetical protein